MPIADPNGSQVCVFASDQRYFLIDYTVDLVRRTDVATPQVDLDTFGPALSLQAADRTTVPDSSGDLGVERVDVAHGSWLHITHSSVANRSGVTDAAVGKSILFGQETLASVIAVKAGIITRQTPATSVHLVWIHLRRLDGSRSCLNCWT